jgi:hypothetical protein
MPKAFYEFVMNEIGSSLRERICLVVLKKKIFPTAEFRTSTARSNYRG